MKPCPYCAETIQDAAAKCRFCGEWLDPSKRPDWAVDAPAVAAPAAAAPAAAEATIPGPPRVEPRLPAFDPPGQRVAPAQAPRATGQSWEAPAWLAEEHAQQSGAPQSAAPPESLVERAANASEPVVPASDHRASLEDVALRMERIKASAAAVRTAVHAEARAAAEREAVPAPVDDPEESAKTMVDGPTLRAREAAKAAAVSAYEDTAHEDEAAALPSFGHSADTLGDDVDRDLDRDLKKDDELDGDLDDGFNHAAFGDGFDEDLDGEFDDGDDLGEFDDVGAGRPLPWKPIAAGAGVVLVAGLAFFWGRIFPPDPPPDTTAESAEENPDEGSSVAKGAVVAPPTPAPAVPGEGRPVVPEGEPAAVGNPIPAGESGAPPGDPALGAVPPVAAVPEGAPPVQPGAPGAVPIPAAVAPAVPGAPAAALDPATLAQLEEARTMYRKGGKSRLKKANELLETILATRPTHAESLVVAAQVKLELGQPEDALTTATKCTQVAPEMADCWLTIGVLQQDGNEREFAAQAYERYLALAPDGAYAGQVRKQLKKLLKKLQLKKRLP